MAKNKKSFVLYCDLINTVNKLPDDKAGQLLKLILEYVNDTDPSIDDLVLEIAFEPIKQQLKRDLEKYEEKREQWSKAGKQSAKKRKEKQQTLTDVESRSTDSTVNVNDSVNVTDINYNTTFEKFWQSYNKKIDKVKCQRVWAKLTQEEIDKAVRHAPLYSKSTPDIKFRKNPLTYLNGKCWEDEIENPQDKYKGKTLGEIANMR